MPSPLASLNMSLTKPLRIQPTNSGAPQYSDVFNYIDPNMEGAKDWIKGVQNNTVVGYGGPEGTDPIYGMDYTIDQSKIPDKYKGLMTGVYDVQGNGLQANYDMSKLPNKGKLANGMSILDMMSLGTGQSPELYHKSEGGRKQDDWYVKDTSKIYKDPNYGFLTDKLNFAHPPEDMNWLDYVGMAAKMAAGIAMPEFGLGMGLIEGGVNGLSGNKDWRSVLKSVAPSLIGAGLGQLGGLSGLTMPQGLGNFLKYAGMAQKGYGIYNALNNVRRG